MDYLWTAGLLRPKSGGVGVVAPEADFSANITALQEPTSMTVNFTDLSTNTPTEWLWNFGDTTTSTDQNPTKVYTAPGVYTVSLKATNAAGEDTETKAGYITVTAWYRAGGAPAPVAAYRAKGAASYAASLVNVANPGVNNLAEGNGAVTWDGTNGWQFTTAAAKYFDTGVVAANGWSLLVQYSNEAFSNFAFLAGELDTSGKRFGVTTNGSAVNAIRYFSGADISVGPNLTAGNLAVAGQTGYRNGAADAGTIGAWTGATLLSNFIGAGNSSTGAVHFCTANIKAVVFYNTTLTAPQVAAVAAAMANL